MKLSNTILPTFLCGAIILTGCTKPGETTAVGATTGGALGAGVGAVVGAQTGDPWAGAAIGALAGAAAGGAIGNALQAHEEVMQRQDEALERQQRIISTQQSEIKELRRMGQDTITYRAPGDTGSKRIVEERASSIPLVIPPSIANNTFRPSNTPVGSTNSVWRQKDMAAVSTSTKSMAPATATSKKIAEAPIKSAAVASSVAQESSAGAMLSATESADCAKAASEASQAQVQDDVSDKLFHYRRALRLCPSNSGYHNKLGELYLSLNRKDDAKYEFGEALKYDPNNSAAKSNMSKLGR